MAKPRTEVRDYHHLKFQFLSRAESPARLNFPKNNFWKYLKKKFNLTKTEVITKLKLENLGGPAA